MSSTYANMFLLGDIFLRHFYSVYDYGENKVRLGVNIHATDIASISDKPKEYMSIYLLAMGGSAVVSMLWFVIMVRREANSIKFIK